MTDPTKQENIMNLAYGSHGTREDGMCLMEAVALLGNEDHTDHPACCCPILGAFARGINDAMGRGSKGDALRDEHLLPLAPLLVGTQACGAVQTARAEMFARWACTVATPLALDAVGEVEQATTLRGMQDAPLADLRQATKAAEWAGASYAADAARAAKARAASYAASAAASAADAAAYVAYRARSTAPTDASIWAAAATLLREACLIT